MSYNNGFADVYDRIIDRQVDFSSYCDFAIEKCIENSISPQSVLDLGCGSGLFTKHLSKKCKKVTALDLSADMLSIASERVLDNTEFICGDICSFELFSVYDACFCTLDTLNHIVLKRDFNLAVKQISKHIKNGGLFIFDVNTIYKHKKILCNNTFIFEDEDYYLVWQNFLNGDKVDIMLDVFIESDGHYDRFIEDFSERAYSDEYIESVLNKNGLSVVEKYDFESFGAVRNNSEKIIYIAKKG